MTVNPFLNEQITVLDFEGVGYKNIDVGMMKEMAELLEACFPAFLEY